MFCPTTEAKVAGRYFRALTIKSLIVAQRYELRIKLKMKPAYKMTALSPYPGKGLCLAGRAACCTRPSGLPAVLFGGGLPQSEEPEQSRCDGCVRLAGGREICDPINS